jgi:hypothetical protein
MTVYHDREPQSRVLKLETRRQSIIAFARQPVGCGTREALAGARSGTRSQNNDVRFGSEAVLIIRRGHQ